MVSYFFYILLEESKMTNELFNKSNIAKLSNIIPFKDGENWYLELIYKYEDEKGKHTVVIPKAAIPFAQRGLPPIMDKTFYPDLINRPYINCSSSMSLFKSDCNLASERGVKVPYYYFDIITEFAPREMTLDEIEEELGYKVKIINNKDDINEENHM